MSAATVSRTDATETTAYRASFADVVRAERIKLLSLRSTWWTLIALVALGAGLTVLICWGNAEWLASPEADEPPGSFITWGMMIAQIAAVVLGVLTATSEYASGTIRTTFAAVPRRGRVLWAKALLVSVLLFVVGTVTALLGYVGGNYFLDREGVGMAFEGDVVRAMYGSGLYLAGLGLFALAAGILIRHTAGAVTIVIAVIFVLGNMVMLVPGDIGLLLERAMPGNAGGVITSPEPFNPNLWEAWPSFGVFAVEVAVLLALAAVAVRRRDA